MKKYEVKGWVCFYLLLFTLLFMVSCRTVDKTIHATKEEMEQSVFEKINLDNKTASSVSSTELDMQRLMFSQFLSSLNIGYNGQSENDKLLFEMKQTIDGFNLAVSGTGTANYSHTEEKSLQELESRLYTRQDSLHSQQLNAIYGLEAKLVQELYSKNKDVKVTGLTFGAYLWMAIVAVVAFGIGWFGRRISFKNLFSSSH